MKYLFLFIGLLVGISGMEAQAVRTSEGMHPEAQIAFVKKQLKQKEVRITAAYQQLLQHADSALAHSSHALADFNVPGYYQDAQGHRTSSRSLQSDAFDAYACALAYRLSNNTRYLDKARYFLNGWAQTNTGYSNADGPLVMAYSGTALVIAASLLQDSWPEQDKFRTWVTQVYKKACDEIRHRKNNWADWGRFGSVLSAQYLGDDAEIRVNIDLIRRDLFDKITEDGHMPHETRRGNNGIWYTYFSLAPITAACWVAYNATGENLFTMSQGAASLKFALDYLFHYNLHADSWPWFDNPRPGTVANWPGNLFEALALIYDDPKYSSYTKAEPAICISSHHFAWSFPTLMPARFTY